PLEATLRVWDSRSFAEPRVARNGAAAASPRAPQRAAANGQRRKYLLGRGQTAADHSRASRAGRRRFSGRRFGEGFQASRAIGGGRLRAPARGLGGCGRDVHVRALFLPANAELVG